MGGPGIGDDLRNPDLNRIPRGCEPLPQKRGCFPEPRPLARPMRDVDKDGVAALA